MANTHATLAGLFTDIADAIRAKTGGSASIVADDFPDAIAAIPSGGGGVPAAAPGDVNFYDYDGTIVYSYTAAEFAALSALPDNPAHDGLTAQGWNWTLADAQAYVADYGKLNVGQTYITDDGKTRIYITLQEGRLSPFLGVGINGTAVIDWGDGSSDTLTGTSTAVQNTQHVYAAAGSYVISIDVTEGSMILSGHGSYGSQLCWKNSETGNQNRVYQNAVRRVEIGANCRVGSYMAQHCYSLETVTIPRGVQTSIGMNAFSSCYSLRSVTIPDGVTSIGQGAFNACYSLDSAVLPNGVTTLGNSGFYNCYSLSSIALPGSVTSVGTNEFYMNYSLAWATISNGLTSLNNSMFYCAYSLASATVPSGVTSMGTNVFGSCAGAAAYHLRPTTPPTLTNANTFNNIASDCVIYVPQGSLGDYQSASYWSTYASYMREEP